MPSEIDASKIKWDPIEVNKIQWDDKDEKISTDPRLLSLGQQETFIRGSEALVQGLGLGIGGALGGPVGAGLGYSTAENLVAQPVREYFGASKPLSAEERLSKGIKDIPTGVNIDLIGQGIGKGVGKAVEKVAAPFAKTAMKPESVELNNLSKKWGIDLTAEDVMQVGTLGQFESLMAKLWGASDEFSKFRLNQIRQLMSKKAKFEATGAPPEDITVLGNQIKNQVNEFLKVKQGIKDNELNAARNMVLRRIGSTEGYEALGKETLDTITSRSKVIRELARQNYENLNQFIPEGVEIPVKNLESMVDKLLEAELKKPSKWRNQNIIDRLKALKPKEVDPEVLEISKNMSPEALRANPELLAMSQPQRTIPKDWKTLQALRSDMGEMIAREDVALANPATGMAGLGSKEGAVYKQLKQSLDKDMEEFARSQGGRLWEEFQYANAFYRQDYKGVYDNSTIRRVIKTNPNMIIDKLSTPNHFYEASIVKKAMGPQEFDELVKPGITNKLFGVDKNEVFNPKQLSKRLADIGDEQLSKVYSPRELEWLKETAKNGIDIASQPIARPFIQTIAKSSPESIVNQIILNPGSKYMSRNLSEIRGLVDQGTWNQIKATYIEKLFEPNIHGYLPPSTFALRVNKYGDQTHSRLLNPQEVKDLNELKKVAASMQSAERIAGNPSGTGQSILTWGQLGLIFYHPTVGIPAFLAPPMISKLYLSEAGRNYLLKGFKTSIYGKGSAEIAAKIGGIIGAQEMNKE